MATQSSSIATSIPPNKEKLDQVDKAMLMYLLAYKKERWWTSSLQQHTTVILMCFTLKGTGKPAEATGKK